MAGLCKTRRVGVLAACAASFGVGIVLLQPLLPNAIARVQTAELVALLGLLVLPMAATFVLERQSRRSTRHATGTAAEEAPATPGATDQPAAANSDRDEAEPEERDDVWRPVWSAVTAGQRERETVGAGGGGGLMPAMRR